MSWDIVLLSSTEKIISIENLDDEKLLPVDFDKILLENLDSEKKVNQQNESILSADTIDDEINFYFDNELTSNKIVSLYNERALFRIIELAKIHNWQIFDTSLDEMLDLHNPSRNGYSDHQNYVKQVMKNK